MDDQRARALLDAERARVEELLAQVAASSTDDRTGAEEPGDQADGGQRLTAQATDGLVSDSLSERLAAIERAEARLAAGTYGLSVRTGAPIPEARLEADPAAELTVEEAGASEA